MAWTHRARRVSARAFAPPSPTTRTAARRHLYGLPPSVPVTDKCPAPYCDCAPAPPGLDIDTTSPLEGTVAAYDMHVVVQTPSAAWPSRFEEGDSLAARVKAAFARGGRFHDPMRNTLVTACYNDLLPNERPERRVMLFPGFRDATTPSSLSTTATSEEDAARAALVARAATDTADQAAVDELIATCILPHSSTTTTPPPLLPTLASPTVLICGHAARDSRCGATAPLLLAEFRAVFADHGLDDAFTGLITHVGGHKFAGNVIVYVPPGWSFFGHALAGMGVWYGRVEPRHVPGIVAETVGRGRVVRELYRGGMRADEADLRAVEAGRRLRRARRRSGYAV